MWGVDDTALNFHSIRIRKGGYASAVKIERMSVIVRERESWWKTEERREGPTEE